MQQVYGIAIRKGGQGKSTTVSSLARLCALYGARVLVVDLAQPGTTTASFRDLWPETEHGDLASALVSFRMLPAGEKPDAAHTRAALEAVHLPVTLASLPSWSGGCISVLPWDELLSDAAAFLQSEHVLAGLIASVAESVDVVLIDFPAEGGPLMTNALVATDQVLIPLAPETPALEGVEGMLRLMARARDAGHRVALAGLLMTHCDPKNKRVADIVQTIRQSGEVEGESLGRKLYTFGIRQNEFFEQAFRYGEPIWERSSNPSHWSGFVLLAEWLLRDAGLSRLADGRRGPALMPPDTLIFDTSALGIADPELPLDTFEQAHGVVRT